MGQKWLKGTKSYGCLMSFLGKKVTQNALWAWNPEKPKFYSINAFLVGICTTESASHDRWSKFRAFEAICVVYYFDSNLQFGKYIVSNGLLVTSTL